MVQNGNKPPDDGNGVGGDDNSELGSENGKAKGSQGPGSSQGVDRVASADASSTAKGTHGLSYAATLRPSLKRVAIEDLDCEKSDALVRVFRLSNLPPPSFEVFVKSKFKSCLACNAIKIMFNGKPMVALSVHFGERDDFVQAKEFEFTWHNRKVKFVAVDKSETDGGFNLMPRQVKSLWVEGAQLSWITRKDLVRQAFAEYAELLLDKITLVTHNGVLCGQAHIPVKKFIRLPDRSIDVPMVDSSGATIDGALVSVNVVAKGFDILDKSIAAIRKPILCFYCKKHAGHIARKCPVRIAHEKRGFFCKTCRKVGTCSYTNCVALSSMASGVFGSFDSSKVAEMPAVSSGSTALPVIEQISTSSTTTVVDCEGNSKDGTSDTSVPVQVNVDNPGTVTVDTQPPNYNELDIEISSFLKDIDPLLKSARSCASSIKNVTEDESYSEAESAASAPGKGTSPVSSNTRTRRGRRIRCYGGLGNSFKTFLSSGLDLTNLSDSQVKLVLPALSSRQKSLMSVSGLSHRALILSALEYPSKTIEELVAAKSENMVSLKPFNGTTLSPCGSDEASSPKIREGSAEPHFEGTADGNNWAAIDPSDDSSNTRKYQ